MTVRQKTRDSLFKKIGLSGIIAIIGVVGFFGPFANAASPPTTTPPHNLRGMELFNELNRIRGLYHLAPLAVNQALSTSAQRKCADMVDYSYYGHNNPYTGQRGLAYIREGMPAGPISEILNMGPPNTAQHFFESWMNSPGHRNVILKPEYTQVGFAICYAAHVENRIMLVGHFGTL